MNPFQAIMGRFTAPQNQMGISATAMPNAGIGGVFGQVQQLAGMLQNPQRLVSQFFPDAPAEVAHDPDQLLGWMQQTGKVNPQMVQMARQILKGNGSFLK